MTVKCPSSIDLLIVHPILEIEPLF